MGSFDEEAQGPPLTQTRASHAVIEALDGVCMPEVRDRILLAALRAAGMHELPAPDRLGDFAAGPLRTAVTETLGEPAANAVAESLQPIIQRAMARTSAVKRKRDEPVVAETPPPPPPSGETTVVVSTSDSQAVDELREQLEGLAVLHAVPDVWALARAAEVYSASKPRLVVDCRGSEVTAEQLQSLGRMAPPEARVVLWGLGEQAQAVTASAPWKAIEWTGTDAECTAGDLAMLCTGGRASSMPPERRTLRRAQRGPTEQMAGRPVSGAQRRPAKRAVGRLAGGSDAAEQRAPRPRRTRRADGPDEGPDRGHDPPSAPTGAATTRAVAVTSDTAVQRLLEQALSAAGIDHTMLRDAGSALAHLAGSNEPPALVVATLEAREMTPLRFAHAARAVHETPPQVVVLLHDDQFLRGELSSVACVAPRTISADSLAAALRALLE